jgi:hypothetical protein
MATTLPVLLCLGSGFSLVCLVWRRRTASAADIILVASLSVGFGLGIFSVVYFLSLLLGVTHLIRVDVAVFALLIVSVLLFRTRATAVAITVLKDDEPAWLDRLLTIAFVTALCGALYAATMRTLAYPHGDGWDAFSIWNLHARFLFRGGLHWRDGFNPLLPWSHPDYPLLLPAAVAHFWSYIGRDNPAVPAIIGFLFTFSTVGLLFSALSMLRGRMPALLGATALLATPSFIEQGTAQYADVPLSFFMLAAIALLCLHDQRMRDQHTPASPELVLAGLAAAFAAWTKNEGLLFLCAMVVARLWATRARKTPSSNYGTIVARSLTPLLLTVIPAFLLLAGFKHFIAPPGDLFSDPSTTVHKLLVPARYWAVIQWYVKGLFRFGGWWLIPAPLLLLGFYFAAGKKEDAERQTGIRTSIMALALTLAGYFAVYLITPYDIYWHLRFSLTRLFLQLWPSAIFLYFLLVNLQSQTQAASASSETNPRTVNVSK